MPRAISDSEVVDRTGDAIILVGLKNSHQMPRARIGLATQGFSVLRSTTELPRHERTSASDGK